MSPDDSVDDLAGFVSDGESIDWNVAESGAGQDAATVRALHSLSRIARFNAELQLAPLSNHPPDPSADGIQPQRWGHLTILELAGTGARGEVWRAWDSTLQRQVALKFLQTSRDGDATGLEELLREARTLARVHHPNVATVHGIAEHDGVAGMWMEYLQGTTLAEEIDRKGGLPPREVVRVGLGLCAALEALEGAGVVHRDVKPTNVILPPDGRVVLTDFGLGVRARLQDAEIPRSSGTPIFMAPEVLAGGPATASSDLYSLGVTLWWALAGRPPFQAASLEALREQAARGPSMRLDQARRGAPRRLVEGIEWAMKVDAGARPKSGAELGARLREALREIDAIESRPRRRLVASVSIVVLAAVLAGAFLAGHRGEHDRDTDAAPSLAVLPLVNASGDPSQDYFADGITDELISRFAQIGDVRIISHSSVNPFKNSKEPLQEIAGKLHVKMIVEGSAIRSGDRVRISVRLIEARTGRALWAELYNRDAGDILVLQNEVARAVVEHVEAHLTTREQDRLARAREVNPEAHALYLRGLEAYGESTRSGVLRAIELYKMATEADTNYADPWTGLAYAYDWAFAEGLVSLKESEGRVVAAAERALELDPENGPACAILTSHRLSHDRNFESAARGYRAALEMTPGDPNARVEFVVCLTAMGRFDEALAEARRATRSDPLSSSAALNALYPLFEGRRYAEAARGAREILNNRPDFSAALFSLGQALYFEGHREAGIAAMEQSLRLDPVPEAFGWLGLMYGLSGSQQKAGAMLHRLQSMDAKHPIDPYCFAIVHIGLGDKDSAFKYLAKALDEGGGSVIFLKVDPALDGLRGDPRFQALLQRLHMDS